MRLKRVGRKHDPSYRVVITEDFRGPKSGKYLENIGAYDPRKNTKNIDADRVKYWISKGVQISDTVHNILVSEKIIDGKKINVTAKKIGKKATEKAKSKETQETPTEAKDLSTQTEEQVQETGTEKTE